MLSDFFIIDAGFSGFGKMQSLPAFPVQSNATIIQFSDPSVAGTGRSFLQDSSRARIKHGDQGDTAMLLPTIEAADRVLCRVNKKKKFLDVVADKGYQKAELIKELNSNRGITTHIPERETKGRRKWKGDERARTEFHLNRQRCKREHGKALGRKRANLVERAFAHLCGTGGMRRFTTRGLDNGLKRYLIQALAYNLGVLMRKMHGIGTPRRPRERALLPYLALYWLTLLSMLIRIVFPKTTANDRETSTSTVAALLKLCALTAY